MPDIITLLSNFVFQKCFLLCIHFTEMLIIRNAIKILTCVFKLSIELTSKYFRISDRLQMIDKWCNWACMFSTKYLPYEYQLIDPCWTNQYNSHCWQFLVTFHHANKIYPRDTSREQIRYFFPLFTRTLTICRFNFGLRAEGYWGAFGIWNVFFILFCWNEHKMCYAYTIEIKKTQCN